MSEQLGLAGMPRRLWSCTPSKLAAWQDCPRRFRFAYLDRPSPARGRPFAHHTVGLAAHEALRSFWSLPLERRSPEQAEPLVARAWRGQGFRDDAQEAAARVAVVAMVRRHLAALDPADEPLGVERGVGTTTALLAVNGRVDRIDLRPVGDPDGPEEPDGALDVELVVVDYKTGRSPLTSDDTRGSQQLALYALAAARTLRRPCTRVELHHLPTATVHAHRHTEEALARHVSRAEAVAAEAMQAEECYRAGDTEAAFPPRPGVLCGYCDFRAVCPQGRAAAPAKEPWATLDPAYG